MRTCFYVLGFGNFDKKLISFLSNCFIVYYPLKVHFNMQQPVVTFVPEFGGNLRIVSLPSGYTNEDSVTRLVEDILQIGTVSTVNVQQRDTGSVTYYTAFVEFECWVDSPVSRFLQAAFEVEDGEFPTKSVTLEEPSFTWANGKKMFLSFKAVEQKVDGAKKRVNVRNEPVERPLSGDDWKSIYIPLIPDNMFVSDRGGMFPFHSEQLKHIIQHELGIGEVSRIDFVTSENGRSAYVHFTKWYDNGFVENLRNELNVQGNMKLYKFSRFSFMRSPEVGVFRPAFLVFKINHKPIDEAPVDANVHQLVAANKFLDALVKEQAAEIAQLKAKLAGEQADEADLGVDGKGPMTISEILTEI
jgi:hypothetical protein